jgi:hypothetical protein
MSYGYTKKEALKVLVAQLEMEYQSTDPSSEEIEIEI